MVFDILKPFPEKSGKSEPECKDRSKKVCAECGESGLKESNKYTTASGETLDLCGGCYRVYANENIPLILKRVHSIVALYDIGSAREIYNDMGYQAYLVEYHQFLRVEKNSWLEIVSEKRNLFITKNIGYDVEEDDAIDSLIEVIKLVEKSDFRLPATMTIDEYVEFSKHTQNAYISNMVVNGRSNIDTIVAKNITALCDLCEPLEATIKDINRKL